MGFRIRRSVKLGPTRVNIGKRGITSVSAGGRGGRVNVSKRGVRSTIRTPVKGVSYTTRTRRTGCGPCLIPVLASAVVVVVLMLTLARRGGKGVA